MAATPTVMQMPSGMQWGVAVAFSGSQDARRVALDRAQELGIGWVKHQLLWSSVEGSRKGEFHWAAMDAIASEVSARGLRLLLSVVAAPDWARPAGDDRSVHGLPSNSQDLADFLAAVTTRYRSKVHAIEVWNEPNLWMEVGGKGRMNAGAYLAALRLAYGVIKQAAPEIIVVSAALSPTGTNDGRIAVDDRQYLRQLVAGGLVRVSDAIGAHPAGYNLPPDADWRSFTGCRAFVAPCTYRHPSWSFLATLEDYRAIMAEPGDRDKPIWVTEFGWASSLGKRINGYAYADDNSAWHAGQYARQAYELAKNRAWVGAMFYWNLNYAVVDGINNERSLFSLLDADGNLRDAFNALKALPK